ncbi:MAG: DNA repair protein RecO [Pseudomonadota bacterium]
MSWREEAVLLSTRPHGETSAIVNVLTDAHGRHAGVVRGGTSRRMAPILQPGAQLEVTWSARLGEHLGSVTVEPLRSRAAGFLADGLSLDGLGALTGLLVQLLPERQAQPGLFPRTVTLLDLMGATEAWPLAYLQWELALLETLGNGLDLTRCALSDSTEDLIYISPRSGRAVARGAAGDWANRLLPLPACLVGGGTQVNAEIATALDITGHFLARLAEAELPDARARFRTRLSRS